MARPDRRWLAKLQAATTVSDCADQTSSLVRSWRVFIVVGADAHAHGERTWLSSIPHAAADLNCV